MAEFAYNKIKNASIGYAPFELNCGYYPYVSFKKNVDPRSRLMLASELLSKLQKLTNICRKNLLPAQKL